MRLKIVLLLLYISLTATLSFFHEPWRDEVDSWLMARDASLSAITKISPNAGTPVLWYFLLKPFAVHNFPYFTQKILNLFLLWIAAGLLIFESPLSLMVLGSLCFSWFLSYEYSVVARNYGLGVLGLFLLLGSWSKKTLPLLKQIQFFVSWPFLCFSSVHFLALCPGLLGLDYLHRKRENFNKLSYSRYIWPILVFVLSVYILWPTGSGQMSSSFIDRFNLSNWYKAMSMGVFPFFSTRGILSVLAPIMIYKFFRLSLPDKRRRNLLYFMFWSVNGIFIFKYFHPAHRYAGFNWILLLVSCWVGLLYGEEEAPNETKKRALQISLFWGVLTLINAPDIVSHWKMEVRHLYTDAGKTAQFLKDSGLVDKPTSCFSDARCSAILGYINQKKRFWYPGQQNWGTHMFWDANYAKSIGISSEEAVTRAHLFFAGERQIKDFVHISVEPIENPERFGLKLVFSDKAEGWSRDDERFYVYSTSPQEVDLN